MNNDRSLIIVVTTHLVGKGEGAAVLKQPLEQKIAACLQATASDNPRERAGGRPVYTK